jgi:hypothetical protein
MKYMLIGSNAQKNIYLITVKEVVIVTMKNALKKIYVFDVKNKFVIDNFDMQNPKTQKHILQIDSQ